MKPWLILLTILISGCATERYQIPDWNTVERDATQEAVDPDALPDLCDIDRDTGAWSLECWQIFVRYVEIAETNTEVAQLMADGLRKSDAAYDHLVAAGKLEQQLAQIRADLLEDERRAHRMDNWFYRGLIALGLLGAAL